MPHIPDEYSVDLNPSSVLLVNPTPLKSKLGDMEGTVGTDLSVMGDVVEKGSVTCIEEAVTKTEQSGASMMEGVEYTSRPPSPPSSGSQTPTRREHVVPLRWRPQVPPPNYGATKDGCLYRSAFPQDRNLGFLRSLEVKSILCLVDTEPTEQYGQWLQDGGIKRLRVDIAPNKEGKVKTTWDSLCEALLIVMNSANYPLYVHCNQGRHRTGCLVACLRKVQRWPLEDVLAEYRAYANPKARPGDVDLITAFDPDAVFEYAKKNGFLDSIPFMKRMDSAIANIDALAEALSGRPPYCDDIDLSSGISNASTFSDDGLEMPLAVINGTPPTETAPKRPGLQRLHSSQSRINQQNAIEQSRVLEHAEAVEADDEIAIDPALDGEEPMTSVVELSEDVLTPPAEPSSAKMLGAA